jgi:hypothetical protein
MMGRTEDRGNPILAAGGYLKFSVQPEKSKVKSRRSKVDQLEMGGTNYGNSSLRIFCLPLFM